MLVLYKSNFSNRNNSERNTPIMFKHDLITQFIICRLVRFELDKIAFKAVFLWVASTQTRKHRNNTKEIKIKKLHETSVQHVSYLVKSPEQSTWYVLRMSHLSRSSTSPSSYETTSCLSPASLKFIHHHGHHLRD